MFSSIERQDIQDKIISLCKTHSHIVGAIHVGSGAIGFTDVLSDVDISIVVDDKKNLSDVMEYISNHIKHLSSLIYFKELSQRQLQVYLTKDFLEIDLGYMYLDAVEARRSRWKIAFDKTGNLSERMDNSWKRNQSVNNGKTVATDSGKRYDAIADEIWHYLFHAVIALKRGLFWRYFGEMQCARNALIELKGYRYGLETKRFRCVDDFPEKEVQIIQSTLPIADNNQVCKIAVQNLTNAIYDELDNYFNHDESYQVKRAHVNNFIETIL